MAVTKADTVRRRYALTATRTDHPKAHSSAAIRALRAEQASQNWMFRALRAMRLRERLVGTKSAIGVS